MNLARQSAFVHANGQLKSYPAIHANNGLKVVQLQWTNHFAVVHPSGFIVPLSRTFDRDKAIAFCDDCATHSEVTNPIYRLFGESELDLLTGIFLRLQM